MKYMCVQPATKYYAWQVEVMITSFLKQGVDPASIEVICSYQEYVPDEWLILKANYPVKMYFYKDTRFRPNYVSSVRPHVLNKHWKAHPELEEEVIFYHDCDIALVKPLDIDDLLEDDISYLSDTVSYIGSSYIRSKGEQYLDLMADIVGIPKPMVIHNHDASGGAQYLLKRIPQGFWEKVYWDSENLFRQVNSLIAKEKAEHPIQIWCADMWAVLWNLWLYNKVTKVEPRLAFTWATDALERINNNAIYHNAGATEASRHTFYKYHFLDILPYGIKQSDFNPTLCSYWYVGLIEETTKTSVLYNPSL